MRRREGLVVGIESRAPASGSIGVGTKDIVIVRVVRIADGRAAETHGSRLLSGIGTLSLSVQLREQITLVAGESGRSLAGLSHVGVVLRPELLDELSVLLGLRLVGLGSFANRRQLLREASLLGRRFTKLALDVLVLCSQLLQANLKVPVVVLVTVCR